MEDSYPDIQNLLRLDEADPCDSEEAAPEQEAELLETQIEEENIKPALKLDYKLKTCAERAALVNDIVAQTPQANLTPRYLEILGDYIMGGITKEEKKERLYLTDNRRITVDRRETSFEGLVEKFENGEDGIYNFITNDKNIIFQPKQEITQEDLDTVPGLRQLKDAMTEIEAAGKAAIGRNKFLLKKQLIEMRRDQYVLKKSYKMPMQYIVSQNSKPSIDLSEHKTLDEKGEPYSDGLISLFNEKHIAALLNYYNALKIETKGRFQDDFYYLLDYFDTLLEQALAPYPMYQEIVAMKFNGKTNLEIQKTLLDKYHERHSVQYISALWAQRIPKIIADTEKENYLWYYYAIEERGPMKRCSCCKQLKPAHAQFFSRNKTSKDGYYSLCKECRKKKK